MAGRDGWHYYYRIVGCSGTGRKSVWPSSVTPVPHYQASPRVYDRYRSNCSPTVMLVHLIVLTVSKSNNATASLYNRQLTRLKHGSLSIMSWRQCFRVRIEGHLDCQQGTVLRTQGHPKISPTILVTQLDQEIQGTSYSAIPTACARNNKIQSPILKPFHCVDTAQALRGLQ